MYKALMERCSRVRDKLNEKDVSSTHFLRKLWHVVVWCGGQGVKEFVITGHSLGAAVACVLTVLFKDRHSDAAWINSLRAITFSTPGAIMR